VKLSRAAFDEALAPVMADVERQHPGLLRVAPQPESSESQARLVEPSGRSMELSLGDDDPDYHADAALDLTGQVQEFACEVVWTTTGRAGWPECPGHPRGHSLDFGRHGDRVFWFCPRDGHVVSEVGSLGLAGDDDLDFSFTPNDPFPGDHMTGEEAESLAAEMRTTGAPGARVGRIGLRNVVEFPVPNGNVLSVVDRADWEGFRAHMTERPREPDRQSASFGGIVGGTFGPEPTPENGNG
jgi:hypothetical protein